MQTGQVYWQDGNYHFYAICLLYVLSTADFISDLAALMIEASDNLICILRVLFFYQLCRRMSVHQFP